MEFVVNANNPPTASYLVLHKASCRDICSEKRTNWTTGQYLKVCSQVLKELENWAETSVGGELQACKHCMQAETSH